MRARRRYFAATALGLSILFGFVVPIGDTLPSFAVSASEEDTSAEFSDESEQEETSDPTPEAPQTPAPETPAPETPDPEAPQPEAPSPEAPEQPEVIEPEQPDEPEKAPDSAPPATPEQPRAPMQPMALGDSCSFANAGSGAYAQSLCWLDLEGFTTAYNVNISTVPSGPFNGRWRTTIVAESQLKNLQGEPHQSVTVTGGSYLTYDFAVQNAKNELKKFLHENNGVYYGSIDDYPISVTESGFKIKALLTVSSAAGARGLAAEAEAFPTWTSAFLGNNNFYIGVDGEPALSQIIEEDANVAQRTTTATLSNIQMFDRDNNRVLEFALVVADAESTNNKESITWSHNNGAGFKWLPNDPVAWNSATTDLARKQAAVGNACNATSANQFYKNTPPAGLPQTRDCKADSGQPTPLTGTPMLQISPVNTSSNFQVSQAMLGNGLQSVAFGVIFGGAKVTVDVADRIFDTNGASSEAIFGASLARQSGTIETAETFGTETTATTGPQYLAIDPIVGAPITFASTVIGDDASSYLTSWVCYRETPLSTTRVRWPTSGTSSEPPTGPNALVKGAEFLDCTVTYTPPYLTLIKQVDNDGTDATHTAANFELTATGSPDNDFNSVAKKRFGSPAAKLPVAMGNYAFSEAGPSGSEAWPFGYDWTDLACSANAGSTGPGIFEKNTEQHTGIITGGTLEIAKGNDISCTFDNRANQPELVVSKKSVPGSDTTLSAGETVTYTLTFDNRDGTAAIYDDDFKYIDHLKDVLDDADFKANSIRYGDEIADPTEEDPLTPGITALAPNNAQQQIAISGEVPARAVRTVSFQVTVKDNETNATDRQNANGPLNGYSLQNFVTAEGDTVPTSCEPPEEGEEATCTVNPVRAWTISKDSLPGDGAVIQSGGIVHYQVKVTNFSGENLTDITIEDDLTQTLAAATWNPNPDDVVEVSYGVGYYGGAGGDELVWEEPWTTQNAPIPFFEADDPDPGLPSGNPFPFGTWTLEIPLDLPTEIDNKKVTYAIVGYSVQAGFVAKPGAPHEKFEYDGGITLKALPDAVWVNTVQTGPATINGQPEPLSPNRCVLVEGETAPGENSDCKTLHRLGENYFHLWKKTADTTTGQSTNLIDSTFMLADTEDDAHDGMPSRWLCRTNYAVPYPNQVDSEGALVGSITGNTGLDFGEDSTTYESIKLANQNRATHNSDEGLEPDDVGYLPPHEQCGLFFHLNNDSEGHPKGTWRAIDVRGGDTNANGDPVQDWRIDSANNGPTDSEGIHGTYWLAETVSPKDHQLLAQPMQMWVAPNSPTPEALGLAPGDLQWYNYQGRLSVPVHGLGETGINGQGLGGGDEIRKVCASPNQLPDHNQPNCVMPTGWTMPIFDAKLQPLPLTGGQWVTMVSLGGGLVLITAISGTWWWRRRQSLAAETQTDPVGGVH